MIGKEGQRRLNRILKKFVIVLRFKKVNNSYVTHNIVHLTMLIFGLKNIICRIICIHD